MEEWDLLVRQGRRANLLASLAIRFIDSGHMDIVPHNPKMHFISALRVVERQESAIRWEAQCIQRELSRIGFPVILLKGAAYVFAGLPNARGRVFTDVDVLFPKAQIPFVESELMRQGWQGSHHDEYDQRYYRQWMHEIPPMQHISRGTTIDVHHTLLPETAKIRMDSSPLFRDAIAIGDSGLAVLNPADMLLHSATHLFHEGEFENGLRDLLDLDSMFRDFGNTLGFWDGLIPRAQRLGLMRPLFYALRYCERILETPIPLSVLMVAELYSPPLWQLSIIDSCYRQALRPVHSSTTSFRTLLARFALYLRSHWLKMPIHLLVVHLGRKAIFRLIPTSHEKEQA